MGETIYHRVRSREQPRGWAFSCSLLAHAGIITALGLFLHAPPIPLNLPRPIKVELVSMPAAPKVPKRILPPPVIQEPVFAPPVQKHQPIIKQKNKPAPDLNAAVILSPKSEPVPAQTATTTEPEKTVATEAVQPFREELLFVTPEVAPIASSTEVGIGDALVPVAASGDNRLQNYSNVIRERIDKVKRYPLMARKAGKQGTVVVKFRVNRQGELLDSQVVNSCGTKALDKAALKALSRASPFAPLPDNLPSPHSFSLQINFSLAG